MKGAIQSYVRRVRGFSRNAKLYLAATLLRSVTLGLSSLLFNLYMISMGYDTAFIGLNNALLSIGSVLCSLPAGIIADRIGRKRAMAIGQIGMTIAMFGLALSGRREVILASHAVWGVVGVLYLTSMAPFLAENSTLEDRSTLFTLNSALMNFVSFLVMAVGGYLPLLFARLLRVNPESTTAYRGVMLMAAVTMIVALVPILSFEDRRRRPEQRVRAPGLHFWQRFSRPTLVLKLLLPQALVAFGAGLVFPFINLFYKTKFGVSDATLGWILGITNVTAAVIMVVGGSMADRFGKLRAMFAARAFSVPLLLVIGFAPWLPVAVAAHWTRSGFMRIGDPLYMAFAMEQLAEDERATGSSLLSLSWNVGWSAGPYVSGVLQRTLTWEPLFLGTAVFYTLSLSLIYWFFLRGEKRAQRT